MRRSTTALLAISLTLASIALSITVAAAEKPAIPTIPIQEVRFGNGPFLDHTEAIIGVKKGWFDAVGISLIPSPYGTVVPSAQGPSSLISNSVDVISGGVYKFLPAMGKARNLRVFVQKDIFRGWRIMAQPDKGYKSYDDFLKEGLDRRQAFQAVIAQLKKGKIAFEAGPEKVQFLEILFQAAGLPPEDSTALNSLVIADAQSTALMISGRIEFQLGGAPAMTDLSVRKFKPLVTAFDLARNADVIGDAAALVIQRTGWGTTEEYYKANPDTIIRLASVYYRIARFIKQNTEEALSIHVPFLNSVAGSQITMDMARWIYSDLHPFYTFEDQAAWYGDAHDALYYLNEVTARVRDAENKGIFKPGEMDAETIMVADDVYWRLVQLNGEAGPLINRAVHAIQLGPDGENKRQAEALLRIAAAQYSAYNYLDAKRFAEAALAWGEYNAANR